jgi:tryptophan synthase alpha chain
MSRLSEVTKRAAINGQKLLIPYLVAGDPNLSATEKLMHQLVKDGADIIELGIPFSDPSSDGPVIQLGAERAIASGTSLTDVCELMKKFRAKNSATPVVLMGYLNPIELMG